MSHELLYATNNPGKVIEVSKLLKHNGIKVVSPKDLEIDLDVPETGKTLEENAILKAKSFSKVSGGRIVLADDTGLEIDSLNGEPGIHVRRWKDGQTRLTDEEIINYCIERMNGIPKEKRGAQFRTVLALATPDGKLETFDGILRGIILEKPADIRVEGFPFESLFFISEWNMLLGKAHQFKAEEKQGRFNHRERALQKAIPRVKELL
ncbi:MAG: non-canonical purine NTP pyrophosphatase [Patescibacteria group bacterium]